ncbi:hypothetical protein ACLOJK_015059 [Asimina triloba]
MVLAFGFLPEGGFTIGSHQTFDPAIQHHFIHVLVQSLDRLRRAALASRPTPLIAFAASTIRIASIAATLALQSTHGTISTVTTTSAPRFIHHNTSVVTATSASRSIHRTTSVVDATSVPRSTHRVTFATATTRLASRRIKKPGLVS